MFTAKKETPQYIDDLRRARDTRTNEKTEKKAAIIIQRALQQFYHRNAVIKSLRDDIDICLKAEPPNGLELFHSTRKLLFIDKKGKDIKRFDAVCGVILRSMAEENVKSWYVSVAMNKVFAVQWIQQIKCVLQLVCEHLKDIKPDTAKGRSRVEVYLEMITIFTDYSLWKMAAKRGQSLRPILSQLCTNVTSHLVEKGMYTSVHNLLLNGLGCPHPGLTKVTLPAALALRCLSLCGLPVHMVTLFVNNMLTVPALMLHLNNMSPETCDQLKSIKILQHILVVLVDKPECHQIVFKSLNGNRALSLLCNIVHLVHLEKETIQPAELDRVMVVASELLRICFEKSGTKQSSHTTWHPVFGWFEQKSDKRYMEAMCHILKQLDLLWRREFVSLLFTPLLALTPAAEPSTTTIKKGASKSRLQKFKLFLSNISSSNNKLPSDIERRILNACSFYQLCMKCLPSSRMDFLTCISYHGDVIPKLWYFLGTLTKLNAESLSQAISNTKFEQQIDAFRLFCQVACHLIVVLDDSEFYEKEEPFRLSDLVELSHLLNHVAFHLIWKVSKSPIRDDVLHDCLLLHSVLYARDSRRQFCPDNFWLIKDLKFSTFLSEFRNKKERALKLLTELPQILPHRNRVELFRERVKTEKKALGIIREGDLPAPSSYITIHRTRLLMDGHDQLSTLTSKSLKSTVKVKFINEQGLEEAGIDEHGVFKEFLEDIVKEAFNPDLNLFKISSEGRLYPSPTSHINPHHLSYFEFLGKLLGKAVYEGIVVDVPFARFFLVQVLGHHHHTLYSPYDELPSLDPQLFKSLQDVKNYEGDVADLMLTFSWEEEFLGKLIMHELKEAGSLTPVTNENRIGYIHRLAHFRMYTQIKDQRLSFVRGFRSVIPQEWLLCFSAPELQRLISGDNVEMDVDDLRRNTEYYGGYHSSHRVIGWLWDVLRRDFSKEEKSAFLKFVTSCSRPPLLGFSHLQPKFSIRFVDIGEDQDSGDTVLSVMKGFFSVRRQQSDVRLPTASTCFNLLKLPNYGKRSTLRDKLRYAIQANAGFELS